MANKDADKQASIQNPGAGSSLQFAGDDELLKPLVEFQERAENWMKEVTAQVARLASGSEREERRREALEKRIADIEQRIRSLLTLTEMISSDKNPFAATSAPQHQSASGPAPTVHPGTQGATPADAQAPQGDLSSEQYDASDLQQQSSRHDEPTKTPSSASSAQDEAAAEANGPEQDADEEVEPFVPEDPSEALEEPSLSQETPTQTIEPDEKPADLIEGPSEIPGRTGDLEDHAPADHAPAIEEPTEETPSQEETVEEGHSDHEAPIKLSHQDEEVEFIRVSPEESLEHQEVMEDDDEEPIVLTEDPGPDYRHDDSEEPDPTDVPASNDDTDAEPDAESGRPEQGYHPNDAAREDEEHLTQTDCDEEPNPQAEPEGPSSDSPQAEEVEPETPAQASQQSGTHPSTTAPYAAAHHGEQRPTRSASNPTHNQTTGLEIQGDPVKQRLFVVQWANLVSRAKKGTDIDVFFAFYVDTGWVDPVTVELTHRLTEQLFQQEPHQDTLDLPRLHEETVRLLNENTAPSTTTAPATFPEPSPTQQTQKSRHHDAEDKEEENTEEDTHVHSMRRLDEVKWRLMAIPGVGPERLKNVLDRVGTVQSLARIRAEELSGVPGIDMDVARRLVSLARDDLGQIDADTQEPNDNSPALNA